MKKYKYPLPYVCVVWDDAWKDADNDVTQEQARDQHKPTECHTPGWILEDNEKGITVAGEYSPNGTYRSRTFVLRSLIKEVIPIPALSGQKYKPSPSHTQKAVETPLETSPTSPQSA